MIDLEKAIQENIFEIIETISDEALITDGDGVVLWVNSDFERMYDLERSEAIGHTVYQLEKRGYFKPSIVAIVLEKKQKVTMAQKEKRGRDILVTAAPIFDNNNKVKLVVSFSRDVTEMKSLEKEYSALIKKIEGFALENNDVIKDGTDSGNIVGASIQMQEILSTINRIANLDANVLILGESGVGKSMLAKRIHSMSDRATKPFIDINCAAIPNNLIESELFGYEKGAFTGALNSGKVGLIELADKGTLLLDEISELPLELQAKLLTAVQEKKIRRVGGNKTIDVDFRLIAASNKDLEKYAEEGKFRIDLYYRLNVVNINIPPLRERKDDIIPLIELYTEKYNQKYNFNKSFHSSAIEKLMKYSWPGNIREISNVIERTIVTSRDSQILAHDLPKKILTSNKETANYTEDSSGVNRDIYEGGLTEALEEFEGNLIREAYSKYHNTVAVAKALKISQPTAHRKVKKYVGDISTTGPEPSKSK